jgi:hypothetical protein
LYLFTATAVFFLALQINELKLHVQWSKTSAEEQDTTIAALTGITLPERAARIKTLPSLVRGLRPRNDVLVSIQVPTVQI